MGEQKKDEEVSVRKRGGLRELLDTIMPRETGGFFRHVIKGIIEPRAVDAMDDILKQGIDRILHPDDNSVTYYDERRRREDRDVPYRNYNDMYESRNNSTSYRPDQNDRKSVNPRDIVFSRRDIANKVLNDMKYQIRDDGFCTIGDFYEIVKRITDGRINITATFVEETYGWSNLDGVRPEITYDGRYSLRLPKTERM